MACIVGFSSGAWAQDVEADEDNPLITIVQPTGETQLTSNCTWKPEKGNDNYLEENNAAFYDEGNYLGTLIDGSQQTYWHSDPTNMNLNNEDCYIQVDLMRDDLKQMYFMLNRRYDYYTPGNTYRCGATPIKLEIQVTNTPDDETSWKKAVMLTDIPLAADDQYNWPYMTLLNFSEPYRYLRLVPRLSASASASQAFPYWTISEIQFYPAKKIEDYSQVLQNVVDSIYDLKFDFQVGTTPGYVSQKALDNYNTTLSNALDLLDKSPTNDELKAAIASVRQAVVDIKASVVPISEGWYFIESNYDQFAAKQPNVVKAFYSNDKNLFWGNLDENDAAYYYYLKRMENGTYTVRCGLNDMYIGTIDGDARISTVYVPMAKADTMYQNLSPIGNGSFYINSVLNRNVYHPLGHNNGEGTGGNIVPASIWEPNSTWKFVEADGTKIPDLVAQNEKKEKAQALLDSLKDARFLVFNQMQPVNGLIKTASQMSSNCAWTAANDVDQLIDNNHDTHFHSTTGMDLYVDDEYIQIDLQRTDISKFSIEYWGRNDGVAAGVEWHDSPNKFIVKATNTPDDETSWKEITTLSKGFPGNIHNAHYLSPVIDMKEACQYVRLYVKSTTSKTKYWNISELQLYSQPFEASESSMYAKVPEFKKAVDDLQTIITKADEHINSLEIDGTELEGLAESMEALNEIINSKDRIQAIVDKAGYLAKKLYTKNTSGDIGLIKEVNTQDDGTNQLWSNCTWTTIDQNNDNYSFNAEFIEDNYNLLGALIDNDDQTYWHSNPSGSIAPPSEAYLQIDLKRNDVASFAFRIDRRNDLYLGSNRRGTMPSNAIVYGTNDETIGTDVNGSCSQWTEITALKDIPNPNSDASYWPYFTDEVTPAMPYRYLRFRFTMVHSNLPYVSFSGFQVIEGKDLYDPEKSQYVYVEGMKEAADRMTNLAASVQKKLDNGEATLVDGEELQEAIDAVNALYQDRTGLDKLIAEGQKLVENTETGEEMGQISDEQLLVALDAAITAAQEKQTNTGKFNEVKKNLEDALDAVYANVKSVESGKWYYIKSETFDEDKAGANYYPERSEVKGAALYVLSSYSKGAVEGQYSAGNQLRWGMDDIKNIPTEGDIDAVWRFVPAPDSLGKRVYYIQNMHTGWYMGNCNIAGGDYYMSGSATPFPFKVTFIGHGQFNIEAMGGDRPNKLVSFGDNARQVRLDESSTSDYNTRTSFTFEEFNTDENTQVAVRYENNSARIVTFPFDVRGLDLNDNVHAFQIHSQPSETTLGLVEKTEFKAGEPFILVIGDTTSYIDNHDRVELMLETPMDLSVKSDTVNGLVAAMNGASLKASGYGYFNTNVLCVSDSTKKAVSINAHSGYIDSGLITPLEGEPDVVISVFGEGVLNSIKKAVLEGNAKVNVYTVDGTLVKRNVKAADAVKGLARGIYVVGKKKVLVK